MGVNYYLFQPNNEPLHIGKSNVGCCFALHVIPETGINTLDDWRKLWFAPGAVIRNSRNDVVLPEMMATIVAARTWYTPLRHSDIDGVHCIGHGPDDATYDYILGDFE